MTKLGAAVKRFNLHFQDWDLDYAQSEDYQDQLEFGFSLNFEATAIEFKVVTFSW